MILPILTLVQKYKLVVIFCNKKVSFYINAKSFLEEPYPRKHECHSFGTKLATLDANQFPRSF